MYWLLEDDCFGRRHDELIDQFNRFGIDYNVHTFRHLTHQIIPSVPKRERIMVFGSICLGREACKQGWAPGIYHNENFDFAIQRQHWGDAMLNADAFVCPFLEIPYQPVPFFIRPVHDTKSIKGAVYDWGEYCDLRDRLTKGTFAGHDASESLMAETL